MSAETRSRGMASLLQGDFGEAWLQAVAAGSGILHGRPSTVDLDKADVQLSLPTLLSGDDERTVKVQVKTALDFTADSDGTAHFELDVPTYEVLRAVRRTVRRVLAVIWLERDGDRIRLQDDGTLLVGRSAWVSLEDGDATSNTSSVTIRVPLANTIDQPGLLRMLELYGVPRSSQVPDVDWWSGA